MEEERLQRYLRRVGRSWEEDFELFEKSRLPDGKALMVYGHWPRPSEDFAPANFAALESALHAAPGAEHHNIIFAPQQAQNYKFADVLSKTFFQKYHTRGYKLRMRHVNADRGPYLRPERVKYPQKGPKQKHHFNLGQDRGDDRPGEGWWRASRLQSATFRNVTSWQAFKEVTSFRPHPRDILFTAASHLFLTGGVFHDYTFLFHGRGVHDLLYDAAAEPRAWASGACESPIRNDGWTPVEALFLFAPRPELAAFRCLLEKYDAAAKSQNVDPADVNSTLLRRCLRLSDSSEASAPLTPEAHERLLHHGGCLRFVIHACFGATDSAAEAAVTSLDSCASIASRPLPASPESYGALFESATISQQLPQSLSKVGSFAAQNAGVFWLGRRATSGEWRTWAPTSIIGGAVRATSAAHHRHASGIFEQLRAAQYPNCAWKPPVPCGRHQSFLATQWNRTAALLKDVPGAANVLDAAAAKCAPAFVLPGTQKGASTFLWSMIERHPLLLPAVRGKGFKETGVYAHPDLLPEAVARGAPRPWRSWMMGHRNDLPKAYGAHVAAVRDVVHAFPRVTEAEPFITADATVTYMITRGAPMQLALDQPKLKVIFALRDPVERMWSDYRFHWLNYAGKGESKHFDTIAGVGLVSWTKCLSALSLPTAEDPEGDAPSARSGIRRMIRLADEGSEDVSVDLDALTDAFFMLEGRGPSACRSARTHAHFSRSIYAPQIWHWMRHLGRENVKVVTLEEISSRPPAALMDELFDFVGLCRGAGVALGGPDVSVPEGTLKLPRKAGSHNRTPSFDIPAEYKIGNSTFQKLHHVFDGLNAMLFDLIGRELPYGRSPFASKHGFA